MRRTKIIATLGPATSSPEIIGQLVDAGMNIARLNMSHASHDWVRATVKHLRAAAETRQRSIGILMDTQGPAIRTGDLKVPLDLKPGQKFAFTVRGEKSEEEHSVDVNYEHFVSDISVGDVVLLDNGEIQMKVLAKHRNKVECEVLTPGKLGSRRARAALASTPSMRALPAVPAAAPVAPETAPVTHALLTRFAASLVWKKGPSSPLSPQSPASSPVSKAPRLSSFSVQPWP